MGDEAQQQQRDGAALHGDGIALLPQHSRQDAIIHLRSRHRDNVLALLHASLLRGRYATAAGAVAALLAADTFAPDHNPRPAARGSRARDERRARRTGDVVWAALDLLRRHGAPPDQLRRFLRKVAHLFGSAPDIRDTALAELALVLWQQGDVSQAYDVLSAGGGPGAPGAAPAAPGGAADARRFRAAALMGVLRHRQWLTAVGCAPPSVDLGGSGVMGLALQQGLAAGQGAASQAWAKDAERHLKDAHNICPRATWVALLLVQLQLAAGRGSDALQLARSCAAASPCDADAAKLLALTQRLCARPDGAAGARERQAGRRRPGRRRSGAAAGPSGAAGASSGEGGRTEAARSGGGDGAASWHELRDRCLAVLRLDPWAYGALSELTAGAAHCPGCSAALAEALLLHLDCAGLPEFDPPPPSSERRAAAAAAAAAAAEAAASTPVGTPARGGRGVGSAAALGAQRRWRQQQQQQQQQQDAEEQQQAEEDQQEGAAGAAEDEQPLGADTAARYGAWGAAALALARLAGAAMQEALAEASGQAGVAPPPAAAAAAFGGQQPAAQAAPALAAWAQVVDPLLAERRCWWPEALGRQPELEEALAPVERSEAGAAARAPGPRAARSEQGPADEGDANSSMDEDQEEEEEEEEDEEEEEVVVRDDGGVVAAAAAAADLGPWQRRLVCKAVALAFVGGAAGSAYAARALGLLQRAAAARGARRRAPGSGGSDDPMECDELGGNGVGSPEASQNESQGGSERAGGGAGGPSLLGLLERAAAPWPPGACSAAVREAAAAAAALDARCQQLRRAREAAAAPGLGAEGKRVLGAPSAEFGAMLDLPVAWWAAFPPKRRRLLAELEQQQQQDGGGEEGEVGEAARPGCRLGRLLRRPREPAEGAAAAQPGAAAGPRRGGSAARGLDSDTSSDSDGSGGGGVLVRSSSEDGSASSEGSGSSGDRDEGADEDDGLLGTDESEEDDEDSPGSGRGRSSYDSSICGASSSSGGGGSSSDDSRSEDDSSDGHESSGGG